MHTIDPESATETNLAESISFSPSQKICTQIGFVTVSQKGSHLKMKSESRTAIIPMHDEIRIGTLHSILRQAGISSKELEVLWVRLLCDGLVRNNLDHLTSLNFGRDGGSGLGTSPSA
jgi:predicted RNA binding protein YcfA (HicA-like mRNA interferase family)